MSIEYAPKSSVDVGLHPFRWPYAGMTVRTMTVVDCAWIWCSGSSSEMSGAKTGCGSSLKQKINFFNANMIHFCRTYEAKAAISTWVFEKSKCLHLFPFSKASFSNYFTSLHKISYLQISKLDSDCLDCTICVIMNRNTQRLTSLSWCKCVRSQKWEPMSNWYETGISVQ